MSVDLWTLAGDMIIVVAIIWITIILFFYYALKMRARGFKQEPNYKVFFYSGIAWVAIGMIYLLLFLDYLGILFIIIGVLSLIKGLRNRDKWNKYQKPKELAPEQRKIKNIAVFSFLLALILGIVAIIKMFF